MRDRNERNKLIERGLQLTAQLPDIMPDQADERLKPIYNDIKHTLRVPLVNLIFRTLANYPDYLIPMWKQLRGGFSTNGFEQEADKLRERALLEELPETDPNHWEQIEGLAQLRGFNDTIFYVLPKLHLITTAFYEASFGDWPSARRRPAAPGAADEILLGEADGTTKVDMVDPETASQQLKRIFEDIKQTHGHTVASSYYRGIANWPDFLQEAWQTLKPQVSSPEYENLRDYLIDQAGNGVRNLPIEAFDKPAVPAEKKEEIQAVLAAFRYKFIPEMLIDVTFIKALLDGPEEAYTSRFSVARGEEEEEEN